METNTDFAQAPTGLRPTLLTVVCVLSFIGSSIAIVGGIWNCTTADSRAEKAQEAIEKTKERMEDMPQSGFTKWFNLSNIDLSAATIRKSAFIRIIASLFTLIGAIFMWQLRKNGFYLYVVGIIISLIAPLVILGGSMLGGMTVVGNAFIGILFIALYAINLKQMTK